MRKAYPYYVEKRDDLGWDVRKKSDNQLVAFIAYKPESIFSYHVEIPGKIHPIGFSENFQGALGMLD